MVTKSQDDTEENRNNDEKINSSSFVNETDEEDKKESSESGKTNNQDPEILSEMQSQLTYREHIANITTVALPIMLSEIFQNTMPVVDIAFVGNLPNKDDLAAAALATVWFNLWNTTMTGFMTAIDTLLSQSFGGGDLDSFAMWTATSMVIVILTTCFVVVPIVAIVKPLMILFGQDPNLSEEAGQFSYRLLFGLPPLYAFKLLCKYLQTQNIIAPTIYIGLISNGFNVFANWLLIYEMNYGLYGAPIATSITRWFQLFLLGIYIFWNKNKLLKDTFPSMKLVKLQKDIWSMLLKFAISGAFSISAEAWSFEITTILAGLIDTISLDAHIITMTISTFIFLSFPFAIGIATSIRVGQLIGEGKPTDAKKLCFISYGMNISLQIVMIGFVLGFKKELGKVFSSNYEISALVTKLLPLMCIFMLGDAVQANTGGALRGLGRQKLVFQLNILGFWCLAIPVGALLTFVAKIGVAGLWWGFTVGIYSSGIIGLLLLRLKIDWKKEAVKFRLRSSIIQKSLRENQV